MGVGPPFDGQELFLRHTECLVVLPHGLSNELATPACAGVDSARTGVGLGNHAGSPFLSNWAF
jgi:hypothetical protein